MGCRHLLGTKSSWKMYNIVMTLEKKVNLTEIMLKRCTMKLKLKLF